MGLSHVKRVLLGSSLIFFSILSTVVAATVTINTQDRLEFGQALYQVGACDNFVEVVPTRVWDPDTSSFYVSHISIQGLDLRSCPERYIRMRVYSEFDTTSFVPIYQDSDTQLSRILLYANGSRNLFEGIDLFDRNGKRPGQDGLTYSNCPDGLFYDSIDDASTAFCKAFGSQQMKYIKSTGEYVIFFDQSLLTDWGGVTIETAKEVF